MTKQFFRIQLLVGAILIIGCSSDGSKGTSDYEGDNTGECNDGADNDRNGLFDCNDPGCVGSTLCQGTVIGDTTDTSSESASSTDTGTSIIRDTNSDTNTDTGTGTFTDSDTDADTDTDTDTDTDADTDTDTDTDTDADSDSDSDADADADADADSDPNPSDTPWIKTNGNKIVLDDGTVFRGRGANIHDTRGCNACTWWAPDVNEVKRRIDALVDDWGANFMRLCLESYPTAEGRTQWQGPLDDEAYLKDVVDTVRYIGTKPNVYVLVSLWAEPTTTDLCWPTEDTNAVWRVVAEALVDQPHVIFGIINEPESNWNGDEDATVWAAMNSAVAAIREIEAANNSPKHIVAVQGTRNWARDLEYYVDNPITAGGGENIAYETHSYLRTEEFEDIWMNPAETLPVIIGEFGPADLGAGAEMTIEDTINMMDEAEKRDIPWAAWTFHPRCGIPLIEDNSGGGCGADMDIVPTSEWGTLIKDRLAAPWLTK